MIIICEHPLSICGNQRNMPIILIYGNGLINISKKISEIRGEFDKLSIQEFSGKQIDFDQAVVGFSTGGLFAEERLILLEDFDEKVDLEKLPANPETTVVLKFTKNLATNSTLLKKAIELKAQVFNFT